MIYTYAIAPFEDWNRQAWAGALVLTMIVLALAGNHGVDAISVLAFVAHLQPVKVRIAQPTRSSV